MNEPGTSTVLEDVLAGLATPEGRADPHPWWHRLRDLDPAMPTANGVVLITGYLAARDVLADERWRSMGDLAVAGARAEQERKGCPADDADLAGPVDVFAVRPVVSRHLSTAAMSARRDRVAAVVAGLIGALEPDTTVELIGEFASRVPLSVLADLLGAPESDRDLLWRWIAEAGASQGKMGDEPTAAVLSIVTRFMDYLDPLIEHRRATPTDDLLSDLLHAFEANGMTEMDLRRFLLMLVIAAHETTTNLIGNGVHALLRHPDELSRLRADPSLVTTTVEEVLRWDGSVKAVPRYASVDLTVGDRRVAAGTEVAVALAAANRDPAEFADPDRFDIGRRPNPHLALAKGVHHCLGAALARIIGQETLRQLVTRFPELALATEQTTYRDHLVVRGLEELPVELGRLCN
jgi:cytochrome P450